jgi:hypothetical protein
VLRWNTECARAESVALNGQSRGSTRRFADTGGRGGCRGRPGTFLAATAYRSEVFMRGLAILFLTTFVGLAGAATAAAEGCPGGRAPIGAVVRGPVLQIPSATSLCVAQSDSPTTWVEVKLPVWGVSRGAVMAAAFAKNAVCVITADGLGDCRVEAKPLAAEVHSYRALLEAASWR